MTDLSRSQPGVAGCKPAPRDECLSVMRRYLESGIDFTWPEDCGVTVGNHCHVPRWKPVPFKWIRRISDKKASIDMYRGYDHFQFKEAFVVKTIRDSSQIKSRSQACHEVNNMRDLRHPHVAALLGTFLFQERLSILIFPAACCDLHEYMQCLSRELPDLRQEKSRFAEVLSLSEGTRTLVDTTSNENPGQFPCNIAAILPRKVSNHACDLYEYECPLKLPYIGKLQSLQNHFICLAQALDYIHGSDVRHKDIKPENILIDSSGSVVITDFGISRSFPKATPHVTNDQWEWTRKYASPEIMRGKKVPRDDPSDIFSLGCVFLEMATLLLGESLNKFTEHYTTLRNETGVEDAYHCNLPRVHTWIDYLQAAHQPEYRPKQTPETSLVSVQNESLSCGPQAIKIGGPKEEMLISLNAIRQMLDQTPDVRPKAKGLWKNFSRVSSEVCRDCDPRHPEVWKPSELQKQQAEKGTNCRRSLHSVPEDVASSIYANSDSKIRYGGIDSSLLSTQEPRLNHTDRKSNSPRSPPKGDGDSKDTTKRNITNGQSPPVSSSPNAKGQHIQFSSTTLTRSASPTTSAVLDSAKTMASPQAASSQNTRLDPNYNNKVNLTDRTLSTSRTLSINPRSSVSHVSQSTPINRSSLETDPGSLPEKQAHTTIEDGASRPEEDRLPDSTDVMIYDCMGPKLYIAPYASLNGRDYRSYALSRSEQQVVIGDRPKIISKVDLSILGLWVKMRRFKGDFPRIYVVNMPTGRGLQR